MRWVRGFLAGVLLSCSAGASTLTDICDDTQVLGWLRSDGKGFVTTNATVYPGETQYLVTPYSQLLDNRYVYLVQKGGSVNSPLIEITEERLQFIEEIPELGMAVLKTKTPVFTHSYEFIPDTSWDTVEGEQLGRPTSLMSTLLGSVYVCGHTRSGEKLGVPEDGILHPYSTIAIKYDGKSEIVGFEGSEVMTKEDARWDEAAGAPVVVLLEKPVLLGVLANASYEGSWTVQVMTFSGYTHARIEEIIRNDKRIK